MKYPAKIHIFLTCLCLLAVTGIYVHAQDKGDLPTTGTGGKATGIGIGLASLQLPFGGIISSILPCTYKGAPALHVVISSARLATPFAPEFYIWTTATKTLQGGPPSHPTQPVLGMASAQPDFCTLNLPPPVPPIPLPGFFMNFVATGSFFTKETATPGTNGKAN